MTEQWRGGEVADTPPSPLSRRSLLRAGTGVGVLAVAGGMGLPACTVGSPGRNRRIGATLRASMGNAFHDLDPTVAEREGTIAVNDFIYEALYRADRFPPYGITPEIATEMPREITPTKYRIRLRKDVTFHNGSPLTVEDVLFTLRRIQDPKTNNPFLKPFFELITAARATDTHEMELHLSGPTTLLAQRLKLLQVLSKAAVESSDDSLKLAPVGSGPYRVVSAVSEQRVRLERFGNYSGRRKLQFKNVEIGVVTDPNARVAGLRSGDVDVILNVPAAIFDGLKKTRGLKAKAVPGPWSTDIFFNCSQPPFNDARVRRAVLYAIDRDAITKSTFFGLAEPAWAGLIRPNNPEYAKPDTTYRYDPNFAKQLLAEAGYAGKSIRIDFPLASDIEYLWSQGPIIERSLKDVGFESNVIPLAFNAVVSRLVDGNYHLALGAGSRELDPTAEFDLRMHYSGGFPEGFLHWRGDKLKALRQLLDGAALATDEPTFKRRLAEAQNLLQEEVPHSRLHWLQTLTAWSDGLEGFRPVPASGLLLDGVRG